MTEPRGAATPPNLVPCPDCQKDISPRAPTCPHCGAPRTAPPAPTPIPKKSGRGRIILATLFVIVGGCMAILFVSSPSTPPPTKSYLAPARLRIVVDREDLGYGYLKLIGTAENVGHLDAASPRLKLRVMRDGTLLAEDSTWPAGTAGRSLASGDKAAFEFITRVPYGESSRGMTYELSAEKFPYEVKYPR